MISKILPIWLSPGVLFQSRTAQKGANSNVPVDVYCIWCYSWRKLHESGRLVLVYSWMLCVAYNLESNKGEITMTENETIKKVINGLNFLKEKLYNGIYADRLDCIDYAISALKEVQQYREVGTVEEFRKLKERSSDNE